MISYNEEEAVKDILSKVTPEDEEKYLVVLETAESVSEPDFEHHCMRKIIREDKYKNCCADVFKCNNMDDTFEDVRWSSFEDAKKNSWKYIENSEVSHLKEGVEMAFRHHMIFYCPDKCEFSKCFDKWMKIRYNYFNQFKSEDDLNQESKENTSLANSFEEALKNIEN